MTIIPSEISRRIVTTVTNAGVCWLWRKDVDAHRFGYVDLDGKTHRAPHAAWLLVKGEPAGGALIVTCGNQRCINPKHHEVYVHHRHAQTECKRGHAFTDANTYLNAHGHRQCRRCRIMLRKQRKETAVANGRRKAK